MGPMHALPPPSEAEIERSRRLVAALHEEAAGGELDFATYMQRALYAPGLGYYMADGVKFGADGDFVTAPEVSPLFAAAVANAALGVLQHTGGDLLEAGAGSGRLCCDLLQRVAGARQPPGRYYIVEVSPALRARQHALLQRECPQLLAGVEWVAAVPRDFRGVMVANEVADALGVGRFAITDGGIEEICCGFVDGAPGDLQRPAPVALERRVRALETDLGRPFAVGYRSEICVALEHWSEQLAGRLEAGALLVFDYGYPRAEYYLAERDSGTLVCHYRHRANFDPYWYPGVQDISAFVDFTHLAESVTATGLAFEGYTSQARFLLDNGVLAELTPGDRLDRDSVRAINAAKTLLLPGEMGERFCAAAFSRGLDQGVSGFQNPLNHRL